MQRLVNPHLLSEEDAALRRLVRSRVPHAGRIYVSREWLEVEGVDDVP
jgi:hypothetical protein